MNTVDLGEATVAVVLIVLMVVAVVGSVKHKRRITTGWRR